MSDYTNDTSTSSLINSENYIHSGCGTINNTDSSTNSNYNVSWVDMYNRCIYQIGELQKEVKEIRQEQEKNKGFIKWGARLFKSLNTIVWIWLFAPIIQVIGCAVVVYFLEMKNTLPRLLVDVLSYVTIASAIEITLLLFNFIALGNRISTIEKKIGDENE